MNILPVAKRSSAAADFAANLFSGTKNAPGSSNNLKNTPAFADLKNQPAFANLKSESAFSNLKSEPAFADLKSAPPFSDLKHASASSSTKDIPTVSGLSNAPISFNTKNIPAVSGAKNAPAFSDILRQAAEPQRVNSDNSRNIRQDLRDRMPSLIQDSRQGGGRQIRDNTQNSSPRDISAALRTADAPAGGKNSRLNTPQQEAPLEIQQELAALENPQQPASLKSPQQHTPLEKAPTTPHSTNGVHYQLGEITFTQRELAKLRDKLLQEGLSPQSLTVIEQLASHPHGATLGQLLALINGNLLQKVSLSESDKLSLQHFADKIDVSGTLGKNVAQLLENGQSKEAWDAIKSSLAVLNPQDAIVFEATEAALLCRVFGVSPQASLEILKYFDNSAGILLTPDIFTALMLPAQEEILNKVQQDGKLSQALAKHLQPIINEARLRTEKERQAAEGADRRSKQSEILIRDKFMDSFHKDVVAPEKDEGHSPLLSKKDAFGKQNEASSRKDEAGHNPPPIGRKSENADRRAEAQIPQSEAQTQEPEEQLMRPVASDKQNTASGRPEVQPSKAEFAAGTPLTQERAPAAQDSAKAALTAKMPEEAPAPPKTASGQQLVSRTDMNDGRQNPQPPHGEQNQDGNNKNNQDTRRDSQREALLSRIEVRQPAQTNDTHALSSFAMPTQPQAHGAGQTVNPAPFIRHALQQLEQGTLNRLANGEQRLELQLAPSELGAVTLILTSAKSGEISATIRSERTETAELIARHLDIIRVNLEEQGLKVDKLEVRHQMLNNQDDWQGAEQHNAMREEQERREYLERLRRLGRQNENETIQARDMQLPEHTAKISEQGLHLVA